MADLDLPREYGLEQTIDDTLCMGGRTFARRAVPVQIDMLGVVKSVCADGSVHVTPALEGLVLPIDTSPPVGCLGHPTRLKGKH